MNSRVSVAIQWEQMTGANRVEQGFTRVVNGYGCLLVSPKEIDVEQRIRLTNLSSRQMANGVVVWKGPQRTDGWELGVELIAASLDFWGVEL